MNDLKNIFNPKSIAVIGASSNPEKIGYQILKNILYGGYSGRVFPVNPNSNEILGLSVYKNISLIPETIDLVVISLPSKTVFEIVKEAAAHHVKAIIIISSGFSEIGNTELEKQIVGICGKNKIALLGPNCLGAINTESKLNASFSINIPKQGNVGFLSQSGAMISALIDWSRANDTGFSKIISLGNMAQVNELSALEYLYNDKQTEIIIGYLERLVPDDNLSKLMFQNAKKKPTIFLLGGKTSYGQNASKSHTGSILSDYKVTKEYLEESGVIVADSFKDLLNFSRLFSVYRRINGNRFAILTNAGGPSIELADKMHELGLVMAKISDSTTKELIKINENINVANPIDLLGDAQPLEYEKSLSILTADKEIDGIFVIVTPQSSTKIPECAEAISNLDSSTKPVIPIFIGGEKINDGQKILEKKGFPCYSYSTEAALAISQLIDFLSSKSKTVKAIGPGKQFNPSEKYKILKQLNLPLVEYFIVNSEDELISSANKIGYPVVLKIADETAHKTDVGGIKININDETALKAAFAEIGSPAIIGKMVKNDFELFAGGNRNKTNNLATVVFGSGGIYSEIYNDFATRIAPIEEEEALAMIEGTKIGKILSGTRNQKAFDTKKLAVILAKISHFIFDYDIKEVDFNPIIANNEGFFIADSRIIEQKEN